MEEILKDQYYYELDRKEKLEESLSIPITILTALFGALGILVKEIKLSICGTTILFVLFGFVCFILLCITGWKLYKAITPYGYEQLPDSKDLIEYMQAIKKTSDDSERDFKENLIEAYASANDTNKSNNTKKASYIYEAKIFIFWAALFLILSFLPYIIQSR